ncbi:MAG: AAA family ATPase [archaeon]|nr:AAA family ATPase [archaeon]
MGRDKLTFSIAVSGKGGTGKTTITALLIKILSKKVEPMLVIDADPNSNLNEALGIKIENTIGDVRESFLKNKDNLSPEHPKEEYLNYLIQSSIIESDDYDLIVMGRPEGPGCYCFINNVLRKILDSVSQNYPLVLMDTEAGLEHFSRRTTRDIDLLLVATDPTINGARTAKRIKELCKELNINIGKILLIVNRVTPSMEGRIEEVIKTSEIDCVGIIPEDPLIQQFNIEGKPLLDLPSSSIALKAINELVNGLLLQLIKT